MKKLLLIAFIAVATASCKKDSDTQKMIEEPTVQEPTVTNVTFSQAGVSGNPSVKFNVSVSIPQPGSVKEIVLVRTNPTLEETVVSSNPVTGDYITYDHGIGSYPTYPSKFYYHFVFKKTDNTEVASKEFQVY